MVSRTLARYEHLDEFGKCQEEMRRFAEHLSVRSVEEMTKAELRNYAIRLRGRMFSAEKQLASSLTREECEFDQRILLIRDALSIQQRAEAIALKCELHVDWCCLEVGAVTMDFVYDRAQIDSINQILCGLENQCDEDIETASIIKRVLPHANGGDIVDGIARLNRENQRLRLADTLYQVE